MNNSAMCDLYGFKDVSWGWMEYTCFDVEFGVERVKPGLLPYLSWVHQIWEFRLTYMAPNLPVNQLLSDSYDWEQPLWRLQRGTHNAPHTFSGIRCCGIMINISFLGVYINESYQYLFIPSDDRNWSQRKGWSVEHATIRHLDHKWQFSTDGNLSTTS